jgi:hypothetical protein
MRLHMETATAMNYRGSIETTVFYRFTATFHSDAGASFHVDSGKQRSIAEAISVFESECGYEAVRAAEYMCGVRTWQS